MKNSRIKQAQPVRISLHRFHDQVALSLLNTNGTVYMTTTEVCQLVIALTTIAKSVDSEPFAESNCDSPTIELES